MLKIRGIFIPPPMSILNSRLLDKTPIIKIISNITINQFSSMCEIHSLKCAIVVYFLAVHSSRQPDNCVTIVIDISWY